MGGFLGFGNYEKEGKGVGKNEREKKRFFQFFDLFFRKLGRLVQLNLLYILFCIPVVTIGPATAAMTKILREYTLERPVFLYSDFWDAFKENFKQGFAVSVFQGIVIALIYSAVIYYVSMTVKSVWFLLLLGFIGLIGLILLFASYYVYVMMVSVQLNVFQLIRNSILLAFAGARTNILTFLFSTGLLAVSVVFFPISIPLLLLLTFSTRTFISVFNSWQYIYKHLIQPYYEQTGLPNPYEPKDDEADDTLFEDSI